MKTRVVNIQNDRCDVYIGRGGPFGNPYVIGENGDRAEVLRLFKLYFRDRLKRDAPFRDKVMALKGKTIGCFCHPRDCHGHIIAEFLDGPSEPGPATRPQA